MNINEFEQRIKKLELENLTLRQKIASLEKQRSTASGEAFSCDTFNNCEELLKTVFESINLAICLLDPLTNRFLRVNQQWEEMFGYSAAETRGMLLLDLTHVDDKEHFRRSLLGLTRLVGQGAPVLREERRFLHKNGHMICVDLSLKPLFDGNNKLFALVGVALDLVERRQFEQELCMQGTIIKNLSEGVCLARSADKTIVYTNQRLAQMFGYERDELLGRHVSVLRASTRVNQVEEAELQRMLADKGSWGGEVYNIKKDGTTFWTWTGISLFKHADHGQVEILVMFDITDKKVALEKLRQSEAQTNAIIGNSMVGFFTGDREARFLTANQAFCDMLGYSIQELRNMTVPDIEAIETKEQVAQHGRKVIETGSDRFETTFRHKQGRLINVEICVNYEQVVGNFLFGFTNDITTKKKAEQEREQLIRKLELRVNELNCLLGTSTLLERGGEVAWERRLARLVKLIIRAWQYPEITAARLSINDKEFKSANYQPSPFGQSADIIVNGRKQGELEIVYLTAKPTCYEGPFLREERNLLNAVADQIGAFVERKSAEEEQRNIFSMPMALLMLLQPNGLIFKVSAGWRETLGYTGREMEGASVYDFMHPDDRMVARRVVPRAFAAGQTCHIENRCRRKSGGYCTLAWSIYLEPSRNVVYALARDISDTKRNLELEKLNQRLVEEIAQRQEMERQLQQSLQEKETLLKEIHHRVKNNLQVVGSILYLQSLKTKNAETLEVLQTCGDRVRTMALIHEKLYGQGDLARVNFKDYIESLAKYLHRSYVTMTRSVVFNVQADQVFLPIDIAIPCGLIINELVSNSLKYAFQGRERGRIDIFLSFAEDNNLRLSVVDNGVGFPADFDLEKSSSLGLTLIKQLSEQLNGSIELRNTEGVKWIFIFKMTSRA